MAIDGIWIVMASILAVFEISKAVDEHGMVITPEVILEPGTIKYVLSATKVICVLMLLALSRDSHPAPFKCKIAPRSAAAVALLHQD